MYGDIVNPQKLNLSISKSLSKSYEIFASSVESSKERGTFGKFSKYLSNPYGLKEILIFGRILHP